MGLFDGKIRPDGPLAGSRKPDALLRPRTSSIFGDQGRETASSWERCLSDNDTAAAVTGGKFSRGQWEATTEIEDRRESRMAESTFQLRKSASDSGPLETGCGGDALIGTRSLSLGESKTVDREMGSEKADASSSRPKKDKKGFTEDSISWKDKMGWLNLGGIAFPKTSK
jgi:hypothetical protein